MFKPFATVGLLLGLTAFVITLPVSANPIEDTCANSLTWLARPVPASFLKLVCGVYDEGNPFGIRIENAGESVSFEQRSNAEDYGEIIQESDLSEEMEQLLLFLVVLWSQS